MSLRPRASPAGATRIAQLLAYDGPIVNRTPPPCPTSQPYMLRSQGSAPPPEYVKVAVELMKTLGEWRSHVRTVYSSHVSKAFEDPEIVQYQKWWRDKTKIYRTLLDKMKELYDNLSDYFTPTNYAEKMARVNDRVELVLYNLIHELDNTDGKILRDTLQSALDSMDSGATTQ